MVIQKREEREREKPSQNNSSYIPSHQTFPEITGKSIFLSIILAVIMAGSNAYLGLKIGLTVSATIPAAVISIAIFRFFSRSNILENNIVQTATSAGEAIAAAVVFTLPALLMMQVWDHFPFVITTLVVAVGGLLGVLFSIPLRRAYLIENRELKFPEGVATAEVLKAGDHRQSKGESRYLVMGGLFSGLVKFAQSGLMIMGESAYYWTNAAGTVFGFGTGISLVLVGAGYIVGAPVGISMMIGGVFAWIIAVPIYGALFGIPAGMGAYEAAMTIWNENIRMIGVGTMVIGGIWTLVYLVKPIIQAIRSSIATLRSVHLLKDSTIRTERDITMNIVFWGIAILSIPLMIIFDQILGKSDLTLSPVFYWGMIVGITVFCIILGFLCSAIAGYMTGLVGSSNNPLSGVTIMAVLSSSVILLILLGAQINTQASILAAAGLAVIIGAVISNAAAISGDNLQDLKSGQLVGATPWKQQVMLMVGVIAGAIVMAPILQILFEAYGIGNIMPRSGMDPAQALGAPKAAIMAAIAQGVFSHSINWTMFGIGAALAVLIILVDMNLKKNHPTWRLPVLAVAIGIYMPLDITVPVLIGGMITALCDRAMKQKRYRLSDSSFAFKKERAERHGMLFCSGLIAGESIVGILIAIPFAAYQRTDLFKIAPSDFERMGVFLGCLAFIGVCLYLYQTASRLREHEID